jgi:hypothetical protein
MKYRIIIETERSGKQWFYPQRKILFFYWDYFDEDEGYHTAEEAQQIIKNDIYRKQAKHEKKIIKREVYGKC